MLAVDVDAAHLAAVVVDPSGNPAGEPVAIPLDLDGLAASTRDGRLRFAISCLIHIAKAHGSAAIVIEDLDFCEARKQGREHAGRRPSRGRRGKSFRDSCRAPRPEGSGTAWCRCRPTWGWR